MMDNWRRICAEIPPPGTIVQVASMRHMDAIGSMGDRLPGGLYAIIGEDRSHTCCGITMLTVPRSLLDHPRYGEWVWDESFPCDRDSSDPDYMRLLRVPNDVADVVMTLVTLTDTFPTVVDDGWLC